MGGNGRGFQHLAAQPTVRHHHLAQPVLHFTKTKVSPNHLAQALCSEGWCFLLHLLCSNVIKGSKEKERKEMPPMQLTS